MAMDAVRNANMMRMFAYPGIVAAFEVAAAWVKEAEVKFALVLEEDSGVGCWA